MLNKTKHTPTLYIIRAATIAAVYTVTTYILAPISYGPLQFRVSEALTVLPILFPEAIPGLFIGTMLSNLLGGLGLWDIFGGSLVTLMAGIVTYKYKDNVIAYLSPIIFNAFLISIYLSFLFQVPYWLTVIYIGTSEAAVVIFLGYPLVRLLTKAVNKKLI